MDLYHIYCSHDLGVGVVALRRILCCCPVCKASLLQKWIPNIPFEEQISRQPRFQRVNGCKYSEILGDENNWSLVQIEQRKATDAGYFEYLDEEADKLRGEIREHISGVISREIEIGKVGAVVTDDPDAGGYYLVEWTSIPYTCQETDKPKVSGKYLNKVVGAKNWYTKSDIPADHEIDHVGLANASMEGISETNPLPNTFKRKAEAIELGALKICEEDDNFIFDETWRRDQLEDPEYDNYASHEEQQDNSDSESDEEEE